MADQNAPMTAEDVQQFLGIQPDRPIPSQPLAPTNELAGSNFPQIIDPKQNSLSPRTEQALDEQAAPGMRGFLGSIQAGARHARERFRQEHEEPGTPLDVSGSLDPWERLMTEGRLNAKNKLQYLSRKYGDDKVRMTPDGEIFVRVPDTSKPGKMKDIPITSSEKLTAGDVVDLSIYMPETLGYAFGERMLMKLGGKIIHGGEEMARFGAPGVKRAAGRIAAGSVTGEAFGATKDVAANWEDFGQIMFPDVAEQRGKMAAADAVIGGALGVGRFLRNPFASFRSDIQFDRKAAGKYFQAKYGINPPETIGEATGATAFQRIEATIEKKPGGSGPIRAVKQEAEKQLLRLQELMMGPGQKLDEEVGEKAIEAIRQKVEQVNVGAEVAKQGVKKVGKERILGIIGGLTSPEKDLYSEGVGREVRETVIAKRDAAKAEADRLFEAVKSAPGGTGKVFPAEPLQREYKRILSSLPSAEETGTVPITVLGPEGQPLFSQETTQTPMKEHLPPDLLPRLREVINLPAGSKFSLSDLKQMRNDVYDAIARGEGVPGPPSHYLSEIGKALTKVMDESIEKLPDVVSSSDKVNYERLQQAMRDASREGRDIDPIWRQMEALKNKYLGFTPQEFARGGLKEAIQKANDFYKEQVIPFSRQGLTELFRKETEPGFVSNERILQKLFSTTPAYNYNLLKETLGADSPAFARVKRLVADQMIPYEVGEQSIDAKKMIKNLYEFKRQNPEIFKDVFDAKEKELVEQAQYLLLSDNDKIDARQFRNLLTAKDPTAQTLKLLIDAQRLKSELFRNEIVKAIGDGVVDETKLKPVEFVNRVLGNAKFSVSDTQQLMRLLEGQPELQQDLRQKTFEKLFRDSAREAEARDLPRLVRKERTHMLSPVKLAADLKDPTYSRKVEEVLGKEAYEDLQNYIKLMGPLGETEAAYALAGGLAGGTVAGKAEKIISSREGWLKFSGNVLNSFVFSWMLSNKPVRDALSNVVNPYDQKLFLMQVLTSPPFLKSLQKEYGPGAVKVVIDASDSIRKSWQGEIQKHIQENRPAKTASDLGMAAKPMTREDIDKYLGGATTNAPAVAPNNLLPAIRLMNGRIVKAGSKEITHNDIISKNGLKATDIDQRGFVDPSGKFYDREAAAQGTGLETNTQPGRLHSTDLPRAQ